MKIFYDFHIHSVLSPCGDEDMTPNNIVNMAILKGLDVIAVTDHNSCANAQACIDCAKGTSLTVIPGIEVESSEECHIVCLFPTIEQAEQMEAYVDSNLPKIKNRPEIFGNQIIMDSNDCEIGRKDNLLVTATALSVSKTAELAKKLGGVAIPAHIDKSAYSVISNLGFIDDSYGFKTVEIKNPEKFEELNLPHQLERFKIIHNSDAHYLWDIAEREHYIEVNKLTKEGIINILAN